jgi:hypothetical protein
MVSRTTSVTRHGGMYLILRRHPTIAVKPVIVPHPLASLSGPPSSYSPGVYTLMSYTKPGESISPRPRIHALALDCEGGQGLSILLLGRHKSYCEAQGLPAGCTDTPVFCFFRNNRQRPEIYQGGYMRQEAHQGSQSLCHAVETFSVHLCIQRDLELAYCIHGRKHRFYVIIELFHIRYP